MTPSQNTSAVSSWKAHFTFKNVLIISIVIRVILIHYSEYHDAHNVIKYTDIDYRVFTDAAKFLWLPYPADEAARRGDNIGKGVLGRIFGVGDPYTRDTYRYTPLLAAVLTPNIFLYLSFGKYLFAACDILVGVLIRRLLVTNILPRSSPSALPNELDFKATLFTALYLLNPMVFTISTRGSSESTLGALVISTLYFAMNKEWDAAALMLGLSTHWKIYPVIYAASILPAMIGPPLVNKKGKLGITEWVTWGFKLVNPVSIRFALISGGTFAILNVAMYLFWGYPFLYETYLYHFHRLDHRHNFSPYFLPIYLTYISPEDSPEIVLASLPFWQKLIRSPIVSFVPQMGLSLGTGVLFGWSTKNLPFTWFVQTALFVTFNKVCTSQYFLWYLTILPLVLPSLSISTPLSIAMISAWIGSQALWLKTAYDLEFLGKNVFFELWICSIVFFFVNCWIIAEVIRGFTPPSAVSLDEGDEKKES